MRIATVTSVLILVASSAPAMTRHVPSDYPTIQAAIDTSSPGDTVLVDAGTYAENVVMRSGIVLLSAAGATTTTIAASSSNSVIRCTDVNDAVIQGFTISGGGGSLVGDIVAGGGILCVNSSPVIRGNHIWNC